MAKQTKTLYKIIIPSEGNCIYEIRQTEQNSFEIHYSNGWYKSKKWDHDRKMILKELQRIGFYRRFDKNEDLRCISANNRQEGTWMHNVMIVKYWDFSYKKYPF